MSQKLRSLALAGLFAALLPAASGAQTADQFFKGKTVSIYIGFSAGGTYDLFGRLVARHIGKHIPGNPTVVAQSMPGAGSFTLANWMYRIAPKDGTAMGIVTQTLAIEEMLKTPGVNYKAADFNWIGRATANVEITVVSSSAKAQSAEDAKTYETTLAATGAGSPGEGYPKTLNGTIGTKFKLVGPYPGSTDRLDRAEEGQHLRAIRPATGAGDGQCADHGRTRQDPRGSRAFCLLYKRWRNRSVVHRAPRRACRSHRRSAQGLR